MGEVLKGKCPTMKQGNIIKTGIENHQTILLKNTKYRHQCFSHQMNNPHPWQLKKSKS